VFGVAGSSMRGLPSASTLVSPLTPEFAESTAGEPARTWRSPLSGASQRGSAWIPCVSCPVAATKAASEEYVVFPQMIITAGECRNTSS
jgi:hypothetical protein